MAPAAGWICLLPGQPCHTPVVTNTHSTPPVTDAERLERIGQLKARYDADRVEMYALIRNVWPEDRGEPRVVTRRSEVVERSGLSYQTVDNIRAGKTKPRADNRADRDTSERPSPASDAERLERIGFLRDRSASDRAELLALVKDAFPETRGEAKVHGRVGQVCELTGWKREYVSRIRNGDVTA